METQFQQELLRTQLEIQEQTLKNISQEIHDNIGQSLSLAKLNLNTIDINQGDAALAKLESTRELVSKSISDLRDLSKSLNTDAILSPGLLKAIEQELKMIERTGIYQTSISISGNPARHDAKKELILFRIVQEALNNIIKHANATAINISADYNESGLEIRVVDNGTGFDITAHPEGLGLGNMKSRAELIGGQFNFQTDKNGTCIIVSVPIIPA